ncbi:MAG: metal-dependent hydrolase [Actinomycetota bacterium]
MFFWYLGTAILAVGYVFRDPRFDHRLLIVGSVLPLLDGLFGGARALHSITVSVALLAILMLATSGRKPIRSTLLGLPIGMFLHLVFDGAWNDTDTFWWPFTGWSFDEDAGFPPVERGVWSLLLEAIGIVLCVWIWRRHRLSDPERRRHFLRTGQLLA